MKKKETVLNTKRLEITPFVDDELEQFIQQTSDEHLKAAYGQMLEACKEQPDQRIWYVPWKICLKKEKTWIGEVGFKGPQKKASVEIGYGIHKEFEGNGYTTEALEAMLNWAFEQEEVAFVEAETTPENAASLHILQKLNFKPDGQGMEGPRYILEKPQTSWMSIGMLFGLSMGMSFGIAQEHMGIGMSLGMLLGLLWGYCIDHTTKTKMEELRKKRSENTDIID